VAVYAVQALDPPGWQARVGHRLGASSWITVTQAMIDGHAEVSQDRYWIHTDPGRARRDSPTGTTIAHGFLTLSLLSAMAYDVLPGLSGETAVLNYGLDKVRFPAPVAAGARVRGVFTLADVSVRRPGEMIIACDVTVDIAGQARPAVAARWLHLRYTDPKGGPA